MKSKRRIRFTAIALLAALTAFGAPAYFQSPITKADNTPRFKATPIPMGFVYSEANGEAACREATPEEAREMAELSPDVRLRPISPIRPNQQTGLKIMLRGTQQLESFPQAKAAFLKAAATWEGLILTPITIVIDVDFGTNRFGMPFGPSTLGSTLNQFLLTESPEYQSIRQSFIDSANNQAETELYNALPTMGFQTDIGNSDIIVSPSSVFRALRLIAPAANPDSEVGEFGPPPQIAFNSRFLFDFDPGDGIDVSRIDFDAVATHEIGHVLGFFSIAGFQEISNSIPLSLSLLDIFRFRPGTATLASFGTTSRILSSGGEQIFFAGGTELQLSTGRPDATGGDGRQASHWKDNFFIGKTIGIMDPTIAQGERSVITDNDLLAMDSFGYRVLTIKPDPDYSLLFNPNQVTVSRGQAGRFTVIVNRVGGFEGNVTVTAPDTKAIKIKITQPSQSTTGESVSFDFKVKKKAPTGTRQLTFTGRDESGRVRTGILTLVTR
jgi:hypothetical protein